jgi:hypothetical protein
VGSGRPSAESFLMHEHDNYVEAERQAGIESSQSC